MITSGIQPLQNRQVTTHLETEYNADSLKWANHFVTAGFVALENILERTAGKFCVGDELTMADVCLVPQVYNARERFQVNMQQFPIISRISDACTNIKAFKSADPLSQPDNPQKSTET
eukprot:TRINITY_DN32440_c0_g1_i1.p1 TRINITY_DN32440_c0_g1~~TRINITY_DN32440_c0_g1_i1.p1  ORF type:complete len:118 (+),score=7.29 TRINITY_DN32440_c0_g1_i1:329-682(+)